MKTKKPIVMLLSVLSLIVILSLSISASAADETFTEDIFTYRVADNKAIITRVLYDATYTDIYVPETLGGYETTGIESIGSDAGFDFSGQYNNERITIHIPKTITAIDSLSFIDAQFTFVDVDKDNPNFYNDEDGALYYLKPGTDKTFLYAVPKNPDVTVYNVAEGVTDIDSFCFAYNRYIKEVNFSSTVIGININSFFAAKALERVVIPEGITKISNLAFASCSRLKEVILPSTVTEIVSSAFTECYSLERIVIPEGVTSLGIYAFENDVSLKEIYLPSTLKKIEKGALGNTAITDIIYGGTPEQWAQIDIDTQSYYGTRPVIVDTATIHYESNPSSVSSDIKFESENGILTVSGESDIPAGTKSQWRYWNADSKDITTLIIDGNIKNVGAYSFVDFPALSSVIVMTDSIEFDENAFSNCPQLETVIIFGDSNCPSSSFDSCASTVRVFQSSSANHQFSQSNEKINCVPFAFDGSCLSFGGSVSLDPYEFLDSLAAFGMKFENIQKIKFSSLTFEGMKIYYISNGATLKQISQNTLTDCEIYPSINGDEDGAITFNDLVSGISDGSITNFYLVTTDGNYDEVLDPEINIVEQIREFIERALRWIVNLLNKLFNLIKRF